MRFEEGFLYLLARPGFGLDVDEEHVREQSAREVP